MGGAEFRRDRTWRDAAIVLREGGKDTPGFVADCLHFILVVSQAYDADPIKEHSIRGNNALIKCQLPSFVADYLTVMAWHALPRGDRQGDGEEIGRAHV